MTRETIRAQDPRPARSRFRARRSFQSQLPPRRPRPGKAVPLVLGLERECGLVSRFETHRQPRRGRRHAALRRADREVPALVARRLEAPRRRAEGHRRVHPQDLLGARRAQVRLRDDGARLRPQVRSRPDHGGQGSRREGHAGRRRRPSQGLPDRLRSRRERLQGLRRDRWRGGLHRGNAVGSQEPEPTRNITIITSPPRCTAPPPTCRAWMPSAAVRRASSWTTRSASPRCCARFPKKLYPTRRRRLQAHRRRNGTCRWW